MSDPYLPPNSSNQTPGADRQGNATARQVPLSATVQRESGLSTVAIVAIVLVIAAIMAAIFLYPRAADVDQPAVSIENDVGTGGTQPSATGTDPVTPDAAAPATAAPDATAPDAPLPDAAAPDATVPDAAAPADSTAPATGAAPAPQPAP